MAGAFIPKKVVQWDVPLSGLEQVPRVIILSDHIDATYYATFHFPLQYLQAKGLLDFATMSSAGVGTCLSRMGTGEFVRHLVDRVAPHAVIFSRFATPSGNELLEMFRSFDVPTLYYCDDDLLSLPQSLGQGVLTAHGAKQVLETRRACLTVADRILVSSSYLAMVLSAQLPSQRIDVLFYPPYLAPLITQTPKHGCQVEDKPVTIGYMGSKGHQQDLQIAVPALVNVLKQFPMVRFETFGTIVMPEALLRFGERVAAHAPRNSYKEFLQSLYDLRWEVGLAPLADNTFNRCRSPIKFLEYTACNITTVASDVSVYRSVMEAGGGFLVPDHDWDAALDHVVTDVPFRRMCLDHAREVCADQFSLPDVAAGLLATLQVNQPNLGRKRCSGIS